MAIQATQIRRGMTIIHKPAPQSSRVHHHTPAISGNGPDAPSQSEDRHSTGHRFRSTDSVERATLKSTR
jgi:hypothetical protein